MVMMMTVYSLFLTVSVAVVGLVGVQGAVTAEAGTERHVATPVSGYNMGLYSIPYRFKSSPDFVTGFRGLKPGIMRYPGGSPANWWNTSNAWFCDPSEAICADLPSSYQVPDTYNYSLADVEVATTEGGVQGVSFVVNMVSSTMEAQMAILDEMAAKQIPISLVELGNEIYLPDDAGVVAVYPTVEDYAAAAIQWAEAIRDKYPEPRIAVPAYFGGLFSSQGKHDPRYDTWNQRITAYLAAHPTKAIDGFVLHPYFLSGLEGGADGPNSLCFPSLAKGNIFGTPDEQQTAETAYNSTAGLETFLGVIHDGMDNFTSTVSSLTSGRPGARIYVTESNLLSWCGPIRLSWGHGLYALSIALRALANPDVDMALLHDATGNPLFSALFVWPTTMSGLCCGWAGADATQWAPTSLGITYGYGLGAAADNRPYIAPLYFPNAPQLPGYRGTTYPALLGLRFRATTSNPTSTFLLLNADSKPLAVDLSRAFPNSSAPTGLWAQQWQDDHWRWPKQGVSDVNMSWSPLPPSAVAPVPAHGFTLVTTPAE